jgi:hypothetical protein
MSQVFITSRMSRLESDANGPAEAFNTSMGRGNGFEILPNYAVSKA